MGALRTLLPAARGGLFQNGKDVGVLGLMARARREFAIIPTAKLAAQRLHADRDPNSSQVSCAKAISHHRTT